MKKNSDSKMGAIVKFAVCAGLLAVAYLPTLRWMVTRWMESESYYGHGFLIPIVSLVIAWQRRDILKKVKIAGCQAGLIFVVAGAIIHIACLALKVYFVSGFSFVIVLYGLVWYFLGRDMVRNLTFPILFLFAMVPLPIVLLGNLTIKLKLFAAQLSVWVLNHIGFPSIRDGSIIKMPNSFIAVEAPCSGLRSLISLLTLGLLFAYSAKMSYVKKGVLFLSGVPIAIATNVFRITAVAVVNDLYGKKIAMGLFHDMTGYAVFVLAFVGLLGVSKLLGGAES